MYKRLISVSLTALLAAGCGSANEFAKGNPNLPGNFDPAQVYQGFVLGRVKLTPELQPGPVEILTMDGRVFKQLQAGPKGFFYYKDGILPPDFRLRAQRGADTYESEYHGGWKGGTLYINAGTTLACAYHRAHPDMNPQEIESKIRTFLKLPNEFKLSWVSTVRARGFDHKAFFKTVQSRGLNSHLSTLVARMDGRFLFLGDASGNLLAQAFDNLSNQALNTAVGDSVANMGFNFTTASALNSILADLVTVSNQIASLTTEIQSNATAVKLASTLVPLQTDAATINITIGNITDTITAFNVTHPNGSDYNVPSTYAPAQDLIGQVQSLQLAEVTNPIASNITAFDSGGLYQKFVAQQMSDIGLPGNSRYNAYPWRSNQLTEAQLQLISSFATSLTQSGYLEAEYAQVQFGQLAQALTTAAGNIRQRAYQIQKASQQIPDLFMVDEVIYDPQKQVMWFSSSLGFDDFQNTKDLLDNLEVGPYTDWGYPTQTYINELCRDRIGPAGGVNTASGGWDNVALDTVWQGAFEKMGFAMPDYRSSPQDGKEGAFFNVNQTFSSSTDAVDIGIYSWNGGSGALDANPDTDDISPNNASKANILAVRIYGGSGSPESTAAATVPPAYNYEDHANDSSQADDHTASFVADQQSPFQCTFLTADPTLSQVSNNTTGVQLKANGTFRTSFGSWANGSACNITNRVAWSSSNDAIASVSNFGTDPTASNGTSLGVPGPYGFVTWHPPLDGTAPAAVNITAELFGQNSADLSGGSTLNRKATITVNPPANCKPVLRGVYAVPNNQVYNLANNPVTVNMTLIANYQDGRFLDVSNVAFNSATGYGTKWLLEQVNDTNPPIYTAVNSSVTGGFGVFPGAPSNELYLSSALPTSSVRVTASYKDAWGDKSFQCQFKLVKALPTITSIFPLSGAGGSSVIIRGTGFSPGSYVTFGGTPATQTLYGTPEELTAIVPDHSPGSVSVVVHTPDGDSQTVANFTYRN